MTLEDLDRTLPYGLHDSKISSLHYDFSSAQIVMTLTIAYDEFDQIRELASSEGMINVHFEGILLFAFGLPGYDSAFQSPGSMNIVFDSEKPNVLPEELLKVLPPDCLKYSLFLLDTDSYMHIAAKRMCVSRPSVNRP